MKATRGFQIRWAIPVLFIVWLAGFLGRANSVVAGASLGPARASRYIFLSDQSELFQTGGIAGIHRTYTIEGHFLLTVDPNAGTASFSQVDANATDDSPFRHSLDPNEVFNMNGLDGTILDDGTIRFEGKLEDHSSVVIQVTFEDGRVTLVGQTTPPPGSADFFVFTLDAVAEREYGGGSGEPNDPYQIATAADLILLGESLEDYDKHFVLVADIDLDPNLPGSKVFDKAVVASGDLQWFDKLRGFQGTPFAGVFDGSGHTISHVTIKGKDCLGVFGELWPGAEVKNLGVVGVKIAGSGSYVGGLVGLNEYGAVTNCYSTGAVRGSSDVGGLVGRNEGDWNGRDGIVTHCFWDTQTSGQATSAGGTGLTTAEMQTASTFLNAGWDFVGETANGTEDI